MSMLGRPPNGLLFLLSYKLFDSDRGPWDDFF